MQTHTQIVSTLTLVLAASSSLPSVARADGERRLVAGFYGDRIRNPGGFGGYEATLVSRGVHRVLLGMRAGGVALLEGGYGVFAQIEGGYRVQTQVGLFFDVRLGLGYSNYQWQVAFTQADGQASTAVVTGGFFTPLGLVGIGFDFSPKTGLPLSLFALGGGMGLYNADAPFSGAPLLLVGLGYRMGTWRPARAELPTRPVPPAIAPALPQPGEESGVAPIAPSDPNAEPLLTPPVPAGIGDPSLNPPSLPPPPMVPFTPPTAPE